MDISRFKQIRIHLVENVFSKMSFLFLIIFLAFYTMLDCIVISGQVVNSSFEPIKLVKVSTTKYSTITDKNGKFSLSIDSFEDSLVFRRYGFEMKKLIANDFYGTRKIQLSKNLVDIEGIEIKSEKLNSILKNSSSKITIKVDNSESISELISSRAGLNIEGIALGGESKQVSFPGFKSRHTLVMIDNIPVNHSGEGFDISSIPLEIIDSIEIVKGASASTFGSGSMGGIVNFITKKGTNNLEISQTVGSFENYKSSISSTFGKQHFRFYSFVSHNQSKNDFDYKTPESWAEKEYLRRRYNDKKNLDIYSKLSSKIKLVHFENQFRYNNYFKKLPGPIQNLSLYKNSRTKGENIYNKLKISTPKYHSQLNLFIAKDFNIYDNSRLEPPFDTNFMYSKFAKNLQSQRGIYYRSTLAINDFESDFGADYKYEDFSYKEYKPFDDSLEFVPQNSISHIYHENYSAFFKLNYKKDFQQFNIEIQNGIRKDFPINFQNFLSWNISPKIDYYSYIGNFQVGSVFGNSFTLPSFYNLYWKGDSQTIGNPNLKPEESFSQEYFINLSEYSHKLSFSYQHQYLQDMIIWAQDFNKRWKPLNISEVKIQNYQTDLALSFFDFWDFSANYIRTISEDLTKNDDGEPTSFYGNELIYTPRYNLSVENQFKIKEVNIKFQYKKTGHQWSTRDQLSEDKKIAEYEIINVSLNYTKKFRKIELVTGIDLNNIQNNMYEIYKYIPQPGFNMNFKIKIKVRN